MFESLLPPKCFERWIVDFLERDEYAALVAAPDVATRFGRRDRAMLLQTGVRVSELIGLTVADAVLEPDVQAHIFCQGKGRKHAAVAAETCPSILGKRAVPTRFGIISGTFLSRVEDDSFAKRRKTKGFSTACIHFTRHNPLVVRVCSGKR